MELEGSIQYRLDYQPGPLLAFAGPAEPHSWLFFYYQKTLTGQDPAHYEDYACGRIHQRLGDGCLFSGTLIRGQLDRTPNTLARETAALGAAMAGAGQRPLATPSKAEQLAPKYADRD